MIRRWLNERAVVRSGAGLALLTACLFAAGPAQAACTGHVADASTHGSTADDGLTLLRRAVELNKPYGPAHGRPAPCHGAFCSGERGPTAPAVPMTPSAPVERWAATTTAHPAAAEPARALPRDPEARPVSRSPDSVFRPPRLDSSL